MIFEKTKFNDFETVVLMTEQCSAEENIIMDYGFFFLTYLQIQMLTF